MAQETLFCPEHGNFPTRAEFDRHILRHHNDAPPIATASSAIPVGPGVPVNPDLKQMIEMANKPKPTPPPPVTAPVSQPVTPKQTPIKLVYHYEGNCPTCYTPVATLMLDMSTKTTKALFAVSFCKICNKKLGEMKVNPI